MMTNRHSENTDTALRPPEHSQAEGLIRGSTDEGERKTACGDADGESPVGPSGLLSSTGTVSSSGSEDLQHSLDLANAISGGGEVVTAHGDGGAEEYTLGPPRLPCSDRERTADEEILSNVMIKNLDIGGEELPLIQAVQNLPAGVYPLARHIVARTNEYAANDDTTTEHPDEDKAADGGTLRQKTIHLKKLIGRSAKKAKHIAEKYGEKAIKKVKSVRDDTAQSTQQQQQQQQSDDDDDDKAEAPVTTNTDGGKLKQRTDQLKEFMGKSVKISRHMVEKFGERVASKVKSVHKDAAPSPQQEQQQQQSDDDHDDDRSEEVPEADAVDEVEPKQKGQHLKQLLGKSVKGAKYLGEKAVNKVKSVVRDDVFRADQDDEGKPYAGPAKVKAARGFDGPFDFDRVKVVQDLSGEHVGAVWTMKFSPCGRLLATAGQDKAVRVWVLKNAFDYFNNMRTKHNADGHGASPSPSQRSACCSKSDSDVAAGTPEDAGGDTEDTNAPFCQVPFCKFTGHTSEVLDLSWSKYKGHMSDFLDPSWSENFFLLSSSMDKTVRLWHISRGKCLCCFQHFDFVTAVAFHPRKNWFFLSGSLDGKLHLWNVIDKKMVLWNDVDGQKPQLITAASFCGAGKYAIVGTYDGRCIFYDTEHLKYRTQLHVSFSKGRSNMVCRKITGIEPLPGENKILVTSNDSRIRLYDLADMTLLMKYKGHANSRSQIKASFSHDYSFVVSGSEDKYVYVWSTYHDSGKSPSSVRRRDRNDSWEGFKAHNAVVTSAIFAPHPGLIAPQEASRAEKPEAECKSMSSADSETVPSGALKTPGHAEVLLSADFTGAIKVLINVRGREVALKVDAGPHGHGGGARTRWEDSSSGSSGGTGR